MSGHKHPLSLALQANPSDQKEKRIKVDTDTFCCTNPFLGECLSLDETKAKHPSVAANPSKCFATQGLCQQRCALPADLTGKIMLFSGPQDWQKIMKSREQSARAFQIGERPLVVGPAERAKLQKLQEEDFEFAKTTETDYNRLYRLRTKGELNRYEQKQLEELMTNPIYWKQSGSQVRDALYILDLLKQLEKPRFMTQDRLIVNQIMSLLKQKRGVETVNRVMSTLILHAPYTYARPERNALFLGAISAIVRLFPDVWKEYTVQEALLQSMQWHSNFDATRLAVAKELLAVLLPENDDFAADWRDTQFTPSLSQILDLQSNYMEFFKDTCRAYLYGENIRGETHKDIQNRLIRMFNAFFMVHGDVAETSQIWMEMIANDIPIYNAIELLQILCSDFTFPWIMNLSLFVDLLTRRVIDDQEFGVIEQLSDTFDYCNKSIRHHFGKRGSGPLSEETVSAAVHSVNLKLKAQAARASSSTEAAPASSEWKADDWIMKLASDISRHQFLKLHKTLISLKPGVDLEIQKMSEAEKESEPSPAPASASASASASLSLSPTTQTRQLIPAAALSRIRDREQKQRALLQIRPAAPVAQIVEAVAIRPAAAAAAAAIDVLNVGSQNGGIAFALTHVKF
jgi:hypothetical protein